MTLNLAKSLLANDTFKKNLSIRHLELELRIGKLYDNKIIQNPIIQGITKMNIVLTDTQHLMDQISNCKSLAQISSINFERFQPGSNEFDMKMSKFSQHMKKFNAYVNKNQFEFAVQNLLAAQKQLNDPKNIYTKQQFRQIILPYKFFAVRQRIVDATNEQETIIKLNLTQTDYSNGQLGQDFRISQSIEIPILFNVPDSEECQKSVRTRQKFIFDYTDYKLVYDLTDIDEYQKDQGNGTHKLFQIEIELQFSENSIKNAVIENALDRLVNEGLAMCLLCQDYLEPYQQQGNQQHQSSSDDQE